MKERRGSIVKRRNGTWWARVTYLDPLTGRKRDLQRRAKSKGHAAELRDALLRELEQTGDMGVTHEKKLFSDLCDYYESTFVTAPVYVGDRKVAGMRSAYTVRKQIAVLKEHFGNRRLRTVTHADLLKFKLTRLDAPTRNGTKRALASVHRELALLNRMLNVALAEAWILRNPFRSSATPLISMADEHSRERILTFAEEEKLLAACDHPRRRHLKPIIILAVDTGMRRGEILKLVWSDLNFEDMTVSIRALNTKTIKPRTVNMTKRVRSELEALAIAHADHAPESRVFGIADNVKRSFTSARKAAGLDELRFHDLRHTAATRMTQGLSLPEVGRLLGHAQPRTTYRYINVSSDTRLRAASLLDGLLAGSKRQLTGPDACQLIVLTELAGNSDKCDGVEEPS